MNQLGSEISAVVGSISPDVTVASTVTTAWVAAKDFDRFLATIMLGTLGATATVDAKIQEATDASGTGAKDMTGKAITQLTQAGTDASDTQALINVSQSELDAANDFTHIQLSVTVAVATSDVGALLQGFAPVYGPASDTDAASVGEIVN